MAIIQHEAIADPYIHEPKDVATASAREVYVADGAASGAWQKLEIQSLEGVSGNGSIYDCVFSDGAGGFIVATDHAVASIYFFNTGTPYTWAYSASFTKVSPTTGASGFAAEFTEGTDSKITYTGTLPRTGAVTGKLSFKQASGSNKDLQFALYKNGTAIPGSTVVFTSSTATYHQVILSAFTDLATNDYIEIYMRNTGGSGDVDIAAYQLNIQGVL